MKKIITRKIGSFIDTNMVEFSMDSYKNLYSHDIPHALREKRTTVVDQLKQLQAETEPTLKMFEDPETTRQMQSTMDGQILFDYMAEKHVFRQEYLDALYRQAKFQYKCGNYSGVAEYLYLFRILVLATNRHVLGSLWGKLASGIFMQNWDADMGDLTVLKETIDNNSVSSPLQSQQQQT